MTQRAVDSPQEGQMLLVTGMSGAGRSTALKVLEDLGYEAVDNLPLSFLARLAGGPKNEAESRPLAVGIDVRSRDFGSVALQEEVDKLIHADHLDVTLLFLDCEDTVLIRRYAETRRRHPLAADRPVEDGLALERRVIAPLRDRADIVIDTTELTVWDLKQRLATEFANGASTGMAVSVVSFSYRKGLPREADLVIDARFLTNPHYDPALRPLTGRDAAVAAAVEADEDFDAFWTRLTDLLTLTLPRYEREGKSYLTLAIGCTGGRHRSVFIAEKLHLWLQDRHQAGVFGASGLENPIHVIHRDMPKEATAS
ncbi:MAG: RNase adapter RapZ [Alphaproteobacteria bacterium]